MLFNSDIFLFGFLPIVFGVWWLLIHTFSARLCQAWLLLTSCGFYAWWDVRLLPLLLGSVALNFALGRYLMLPHARGRLSVLLLGVAANLGCLAWFKYIDFVITTWNTVAGTELAPVHPILPLAISFFTFQQVAYLVDAYRGRLTDQDPLRYALFVTFFPQLIAGPIVHHHEVMPQFGRGRPRRLDRHLSVGLTILAIGLFKKTVLADGIAAFVDPVFTAAEGGTSLCTGEAWLATLGFTLQIYFDFSSYSDMAIGVARLFGIILPVNFDSPLKATSITELWRCWHITLSRFLREYLYFPLGGSRGSRFETVRNLMITMLLCGLWHGAGWNFVLWGGIHGVLLSFEHLRRQGCDSAVSTARSFPVVRAILARARTCLWLALSFVFFRAETFDGAMTILNSLVGLPASDVAFYAYRAEGLHPSAATLWIAAGFAVAWCLPNTQQMLGRFQPVLDYRFRPDRLTWTGRIAARLQWRPHWSYALASAGLTGIALSAMSQAEEFLYFRF